MHGCPSMRKPLVSANADSCDAAALRARWTLTLRVIALVAHAGNGADVGTKGAAVVGVEGVEAGEDAGAGDGAADVEPLAQGCGARAHVAGNNDAASAADAGTPAG